MSKKHGKKGGREKKRKTPLKLEESDARRNWHDAIGYAICYAIRYAISRERGHPGVEKSEKRAEVDEERRVEESFRRKRIKRTLWKVEIDRYD